MALLTAKIGFEAVTGATLFVDSRFVDSSRGGFQPLPLAHVVGGLCGAACSVGRSRE
jgi:hypothetical protein